MNALPLVADSTMAIAFLATIFGCMATMYGGLFLMLRKFYRIPPPGHALVRTGKGGPKAVNLSGLWVIPFFHREDLLSLAPIRIDLTGTALDSEPAKSRELPRIFQVAVPVERDMILAAASHLPTVPREDAVLLVKNIILDEYERLLAQKSENGSQDSPANRFLDGVEKALNVVGLAITACRRQ